MRDRPRAAPLLVLAVALAGPRPGSAVETRSKTYRTVADFAPGEMDHVSVSPLGRLVLSPDYRRLAELDDPVAWAVVVRDGDLFVATGHDGKVYRVPAAGGKPAVVLDAPELEVHALAVAADGTVYAGSSPDGKVYRVAPGGSSEVFFDPEERYIWALALAADGALLVATGDKGAVYRVARDGASSPLLTAEETHVLSLLVVPDGTLYAGSGGNGYIYKRDREGRTTVLVDTAGSEVKALALDAQGNLYAASTGRPTAGPELPPGVEAGGAGMTATAAEEGGPGGSFEESPPAQQPQPAPSPTPPAVPAPALLPGAYPPASEGRQSWLYRIRPDGLPEELWRSSTETVHALALFRGAVALGTGDEGKVFSIDPATGLASILLDFPGAQVTGLAPRGDGLAVVTANLASGWAVEARPAPEGAYVSPAIDAGHFATWGRLEVKAAGSVRAATRSGNTEKAGSRWSAWEDSPAGEVRSPKGRYLQYRLTLSAPGGKEPPEVKEVELAFLPHNLAPRLKVLTVLDPHVELQSSEAGMGAGAAGAGSRGLPPARPRSGEPAAEVRPPPREQEAYGMRSLRWEAEDPNQDRLRFTVSYRGEAEREWKLLAEDLEEPFLSFDSTAFPDGVYVARVEATDAPSNPDDRALRSELQGEPFVIDNTPPRVEVSEARPEGDKARVRATVADRTSAIQWAEYSLDGLPWRPVFPEDLVFDEREESLAFEVAEVEPGEHTLVVRAQDAARNLGSGKVVFGVAKRGASRPDGE